MAGSFAYQKQLVDGEFQPLGVYTVTVDADYVAPADASLILWNVPGQTVTRTINFNQIPIGSEVQVNVIDSNGELVQDDYTGGTLFSLIGGTSHIAANVRSVDGPLGQIVLSDGTAAQYNIGTSGATVPLLSGTNIWGGDNQFNGRILARGTSSPLPSTATTQIAVLIDHLFFNTSGSAVDSKAWDITNAVPNELLFRMRNDASNAVTNWLRVSRTGMTVDYVEINNAKLGATGGVISAILVGTATWDPGSTATGTVATTTLTVTGAAVGDVAIPSWEDTTADWIVTAFVSAANTVTVNALFMGAVSDDPGSFTLRAWVIKR